MTRKKRETEPFVHRRPAGKGNKQKTKTKQEDSVIKETESEGTDRVTLREPNTQDITNTSTRTVNYQNSNNPIKLKLNLLKQY